MDPFGELDFGEIRKLIVDEIVDFGSENFHPNSSFDHESESDDASSKENLYENTYQIMEDEVQSEALIDRYQENNITKFKEV